ncbi:MAG TPA: hydrogenase maturation protease [Sediminibacterium sp.]|nr:hydrogenase maturation protease [Sediminibacterium sp.]
MRLMIMGIGNFLMGDEGVGVHAVQRLQRSYPDTDILLLDGGTGGFHLLQYFESHDTVILVDATLDEKQPGSIRLLEPRFAKDFPPAMSTHDIGLKDMISALQLMDKLPRICLFTVSIASIQQQGITLTPEVEAALPALLNSIITLSSALGFPFPLQADQKQPDRDWWYALPA